MTSRLLLPTAAELSELRRAGVASIRTHADGTASLTLRRPRRQKRRDSQDAVHNDAPAPQRGRQQHQHQENSDRLSSGQRRRRNIAARKAAAAVQLQRTARGFLGRAMAANLNTTSAATNQPTDQHHQPTALPPAPAQSSPPPSQPSTTLAAALPSSSPTSPRKRSLPTPPPAPPGCEWVDELPRPSPPPAPSPSPPPPSSPSSPRKRSLPTLPPPPAPAQPSPPPLQPPTTTTLTAPPPRHLVAAVEAAASVTNPPPGTRLISPHSIQNVACEAERLFADAAAATARNDPDAARQLTARAEQQRDTALSQLLSIRSSFLRSGITHTFALLPPPSWEGVTTTWEEWL